MTPSVAIVHDYLTQRGGAERVVLSMLKAFPDAPVYTSLYDPAGTFPEFADADVRTTPLNRVGLLRRHHRLAFPLLAPTFSRLEVRADVVLCNSSGWAHGARATGNKIVYCLTPARWLYQSDRYLQGRRPAARTALAATRRWMEAWDHRSMASADRCLTTSRAVRTRLQDIYGIDADVFPPPHSIDPGGDQKPVDGLEPGFVLTVSRLLAYKNVGPTVAAFSEVPDARLVVVGTGPEELRLRAAAPANVGFLGSVSDAELRWLYASCSAVLSASHEDFGLTPLEGAAFGKPCGALRWGGFLDTVIEGETGVFFDEPSPASISGAVTALLDCDWDEGRLRAHAERYSEEAFVANLRRLVAGGGPEGETPAVTRLQQ